VLLYFPLVHAVHAPPLGPVYPVLQTQAETAELLLGDVEFAGHTRQVDADVAAVVGEYVFTAQSMHALASATLLYLPAGQNIHIELSKYLPTVQPSAHLSVSP
jgi:hypothetical protein